MEKKVIPIVVEKVQEDLEVEWHTCPYAQELYGDETLCNCSEEQEYQCAMDI